jgi:sugar phosphate isomerase/epimerase
VIAGREIALCALTVLDAPPPEAVDAAAAAGFDAVTLRLMDASRDEPPALASDTPVRRETLARLRHHGLGVLDVEVVRLRGDTDVDALRGALESAAVLGARHVLAIANEPDEERLAERFRALCDAAAEFGLRAVLEFMVFTSCRTVGDAERIVDRAGHPDAGVLVDTLHLHRSGSSPAELAALAAAHPERYPYAQLCDAPLAAPDGGDKGLFREAVHHRLYPGDGELPLAEAVAALPPGAGLSVETPVYAYRERSAADRAQAAMAATRRLLEP